MSAKFTSGPWRFTPPTFREEALDWHAIRAGERQNLITKVLVLDDDANAHLIAAAPALYEALETCLAIGGPALKKAMNLKGQSPYDIGIEALKLARGES